MLWLFWKDWKIKTRSAEWEEVEFALDLVSGESHCSLIRRVKWVGQADLEKRDKVTAGKKTNQKALLQCYGMKWKCKLLLLRQWRWGTNQLISDFTFTCISVFLCIFLFYLEDNIIYDIFISKRKKF